MVTAASAAAATALNAGEDDLLAQDTRWSSAATFYNNVIGKTTLHGTSRLVSVLNDLSPLTPESRVLDIACGGGSLTLKIKECCSEVPILATDIAEGMLAEVDKLSFPAVRTQQADAVTLAGIPDASFTHGATSFAFNFLPDAHAALHSLHRVLMPGGVAGVAIWGEHLANMLLHVAACAALNPAYVAASWDLPGNWRDVKRHGEALQRAGFTDVRTESFLMPYECGSPAGACDYWFRGTNPVPRKMVSHWVAHSGDVSALEREYLRLATESTEKDGDLFMEAVLAWGRKPRLEVE